MQPLIGISMGSVSVEGPATVRKHALNDPYVRWVLEVGGLPVALPNVQPAAATRLAAEYLSTVDGVLLTGGDDVDPSLYGEARHPACEEPDLVRDGFEIALAKGARRRAIPLLAICRGLQVANVAYGGTLVQDIPSQVGRSVLHRREAPGDPAPEHDVEVVPGTRLHALAGAATMRVNSFHHQAPARVAAGLEVSARTADGVVEALEDPQHPFLLGVQWHPERAVGDPFSRALFAAFVAACKPAGRAAPAGRTP